MSPARRWSRVAVALVTICAAAPAAAYHRSDVPGVPGRCIWWGKRQIPYVLNASAANPAGCTTVANALALARQSLATWSSAKLSAAPAGEPACTDVALVGGGDSTSIVVGYDQQSSANENLVVWRSGTCEPPRVPANDPCLAAGTCADKYNCWDHGTSGTIALTTTSFRVDTGEILDADMELFDRPAGGSAGYYFTCPGAGSPGCGSTQGVPNPPTGGCISMDLGGTVTHEGGHMLGLAHNCESHAGCLDPAATMFASAALGDTNKRDLRDDDVTAICAVYPRGAPVVVDAGTGTINAGAVACQPLASQSPSSSSGGGGCATAGPGGAGALLALAALARLRARRRQRTIAPA